MRVLLTGTFPEDAQKLKGGVQSAISYLAKGLSETPGVEVHVLSRRLRPGLPAAVLTRGPIVFHFLPASSRGELLRRFSPYRAMLDQKLREIKPDIVHAHDGTSYAYASLRSGYPCVVTVHGIRTEDGKYYSRYRLRARNYLYDLLIGRYVIRHVRVLIAISRYVTDYYRRLLHPDVRVHYVCNAIDGRFFNLEREKNGPTVLYAGRVIPRKRLEDLIRAFAPLPSLVPGARLRIAGETDSEPAYVRSLRQLIDEVGVSDRIDFLGQLTESKILQEFRDCRVLALTSAQETSPMVIGQAQAASKPVVATSVGGVPDMIEDGRTGFLVPVCAVDLITDRLRRLLTDGCLAETVGTEAHRFARANYSADSVARQTVQVYRSMKQASARSCAT